MIIACFKIAFMSAVIGYTYSAILIQPGEILHWLFRIFLKFLSKRTMVPGAEVPEELQDMGYIKPKEREVITEHWLLKPLGRCEKCVAGQISFWFFLYCSIFQKYYLQNDATFVLINHVFTICLTILLTKALKKLLENL